MQAGYLYELLVQNFQTRNLPKYFQIISLLGRRLDDETEKITQNRERPHAFCLRFGLLRDT